MLQQILQFKALVVLPLPHVVQNGCFTRQASVLLLIVQVLLLGLSASVPELGLSDLLVEAFVLLKLLNSLLILGKLLHQLEVIWLL